MPFWSTQRYPNRFGDAALVLTGVLGTKHKAGADWLITNVGCNVLPPISDRAYPPLPLRLAAGQAWQRRAIASVQNLCNPTSRRPSRAEPTLESCQREGLAFIRGSPSAAASWPIPPAPAGCRGGA